ncbi:MAG: DUF2914 domain-containing protein [Patescibacteria group bacterium]
MARRYLPRNVQELVHWYERYISPLSLVAGFLADNYILLRRVDLWQTNVLFFTYLTIAAIGIFLINLIEAGRIRWKWMVAVAPLIPVVVQFSFGGLFSGFLSLYSRSAGFAASWVFVIAVAALLIGNERFTRLYVRFAFQMSLYFFVLFSFFIFFLPVVFSAIGPAMFIVSGFASLAVLALFMRTMWLFIPEVVKRERTRVARSVAIIFAVFNVLYFLNLIPPLPLSLKEAGVYHAVTKVGTEYRLSAEQQSWFAELFSYNTVFHTTAGQNAYVYSAVFAPSGLSTVIYHEWQQYDVASNSWLTVTTQSFPINGGRDGGYRGYSVKSNLAPGKWRVNVKTQYGQFVGRVTFTVDDSAQGVPLIDIVR